MKTKIIWLVIGIILGGVLHNNTHYFNKGWQRTQNYIRYLQRPTFQWTMVNVSNAGRTGDAHLIRVRNGKTILIDAGFADLTQKHLIPYLHQQLVKTIDYAFVTHAHRNHYEGMLEIVNSGIHIEQLFFHLPHKAVCDSEIPWGCDYEHAVQTLQRLKQRNVSIHSVALGQMFQLGENASLKVLFVSDGMNTPVGQTDVNDTSLIMMLNVEKYRFLMTGDLNVKLGQYLADHLDNLSADILKVPHHGTEGLAPNSFFEKVQPHYALIPGSQEIWCSPRSERPRKWFLEKGIPIYLNGAKGNVTVIVDDHQLSIQPEPVPSSLCGKASP